MKDLLKFKNLDDLTKHFKSQSRCVEFFAQARWNGERGCPHCGSAKTYVCKGIGKYKCAYCKKLFSITTGTFLENTKLPLRTWLIAMYLCLNHKKGISSLQLAETLGITQKSAWFVLHRVRAMVSQQVPQMLVGAVVEADETFIGGSEKNRHESKKKRVPLYKRLTIGEQRKYQKKTVAWHDKKMVLGVVQRGGKVITKYVDSVSRANIIPFVLNNVPKGATLYTDERNAYKSQRIKTVYNHDSINHKSKVYVRGNVHTNTIENYWSVVKRCINGTYHQLSRKHIQAYLNEFSFRFNNRLNDNNTRFNEALNTCHGRLKYADLIQKESA